MHVYVISSDIILTREIGISPEKVDIEHFSPMTSSLHFNFHHVSQNIWQVIESLSWPISVNTLWLCVTLTLNYFCSHKPHHLRLIAYAPECTRVQLFLCSSFDTVRIRGGQPRNVCAGLSRCLLEFHCGNHLHHRLILSWFAVFCIMIWHLFKMGNN